MKIICSRYGIHFHPLPMFFSLSELLNMEGKKPNFLSSLALMFWMQFSFWQDVSS